MIRSLFSIARVIRCGMVPRELKKMTTDRHTKAAIRAHMEATGEPYSVAARVIAALPIPSGWAAIDRELDGGFDLGSVSLFVDASDHNPGSLVFATLARALMEPNRRVLVVSGTYSERLAERIKAVYHFEVGPLSAAELARIDRHLSKNLIHFEEFDTEEIFAVLNSEENIGAILVDALSWEYYHEESDGGPFSAPSFERELGELRLFTKARSIATVLYSWVPTGSVREKRLELTETAADTVLRVEGSLKSDGELKLSVQRNDIRDFSATQRITINPEGASELPWTGASKPKVWGTKRISMGKAEVPTGKELPVRTVPNPVAPPFKG